jgi:hypothetical protein
MTEQQIVRMLVLGENDLNWYNSNLDNLKNKYNNKFIAFKNQEVLDSDSKLDNLMTKLKDKKIDTSSIFIKFISQVKALL